jgi:integrase
MSRPVLRLATSRASNGEVPTALDHEAKDHMELVTGFLANQQMRGLSTATIKRRRWTLTTFVGGLGDGSLSASTVDIERFLAAKATPATRRALLCDLRAFYRWAASRGHLNAADPTAPIETPKVPKRLPTPLTYDELRRAWESADLELRIIIALGASAGLRVSEIAALRGDDIDLANRVITIRNGKGGKDRTVPMSHHLVTIFTHVGPGPVLRASCGETISAKVRAHFRALDIPKRAHDLRATFCTEVARVSGGDMVLVAQLAGHESIATSQAYVRLIRHGHDIVDALYLDAA